MRTVRERLFERLLSEPFTGSREELAEEIGASSGALNNAIREVREPQHIAEYGWTIPYVRRGDQSSEWRIVDTEALADDDAMRLSQDRRAVEMLKTTRRNIAQASLALASLDGRSREARLWRNTIKMLGGAEASLEMLVGEE